MAFAPLFDLISSASHTEYYSHIPLIPLVSGYLLIGKRNQVTSETGYSPRLGLPILIIGFLGYWLNTIYGERANLNNYTAILVLFSILFWIGSFVLCYSLSSLKKVLFPVLFLGFMIPIPTKVLDGVIYALQIASADTVYWLFRIIGMDFSRDGFVFRMPTISIEVAKQCSGIRSSLALLITSILAGCLFLNNGWHKVLFALIVFPITVLKNGIRIMTLTLLAIHVDEGFLTGGFLHKSGGFIFYIPALVLMGGILIALRKREKIQETGVRNQKTKVSHQKYGLKSL
jgi:exosortase